MPEHRIYSAQFSSVNPLYVQKAERKGRTKQDVNRVIFWLTGYDKVGLDQKLKKERALRTFFAEAPSFHPHSLMIRGVVCGVRVEGGRRPVDA